MMQHEPEGEDTPRSTEPLNISIIRTETALSRFPVHCLTRGEVRIELKNQAGAVFWQVAHTNVHGQPGALAYKIDTLIINRAIEEAEKPLPKVISLGSLSEISRRLGADTTRKGNEKNGNSEPEKQRDDGGKRKTDIRRALLQNAFASINAKITYRTSDREERSLEAAFHRYSIIFTGEKLPDGRKADSVYIVLGDIYLEVLKTAVRRPLDYNYMKTLPPMAQRFYEIVSYQIFAALHHQNERARLRYSEFCLLSTATRYFEFDQVKKQMYKVHLPHLQSGYLAKVNFEATTDEDGRPDWSMIYLPGPNASKEYSEFVGNRKKPALAKGRIPATASRTRVEVARTETLPFIEAPAAASATSTGQVRPEAEKKVLNSVDSPAVQALIEELVRNELNRSDAEKLARTKPEDCRRQLDYLPYAPAFRISKGAYLRSAIEKGFAAPREYSIAAETRRLAQERRELAERKKAQEDAQKARREAQLLKTTQDMDQMKNDDPEAFSRFLSHVEMVKAQMEQGAGRFGKTILQRRMAELDMPEKQGELFEEWRSKEEKQSFIAVAPRHTEPAVVVATQTEESAGDIARLVRTALQVNEEKT